MSAAAEKHDWLVTISDVKVCLAPRWSLIYGATPGSALALGMALRTPGQEVWISIRATDTDPII